VLAAEALAQHERVLGADRDDERQAESESGEGDEQDGGHVPTLGWLPSSVQRMILQRR